MCGEDIDWEENILNESNYIHNVMKNSKTMQNIAVFIILESD
jgi:hypothetical protein